MKFRIPQIVSVLCILLLFSCKKEEEKKETQSNLDGAPTTINQEFDIRVTIEANKVVDITYMTGVTEFAKRTYRYTTDTIFENRFELSKLVSKQKHALTTEKIVFTEDSVFGPDTLNYTKLIRYEYVGDDMDKMFVEQYNLGSTTPIASQFLYWYSNNNLERITYESSTPGDDACSDTYERNGFQAKYDVHNVLGVSEGSVSNNLKATLNLFSACNGNGINGSTQYLYWYELDSDSLINTLIYQKIRNNSTQTFKENYSYFIR